jgi:iron complex transport system ATP-binding protein
MTQLEVTDVTVKRTGRPIVSDVTWRGVAGEFVAVIGPNGAGKSTLLSAMAGLLQPDSGQVRLNGQDIRTLRRQTLARCRSYLPQNPRSDWPLPVHRLVALGLTPVLPTFGGLSQGDQQKVDQVLSQCDLMKHREQPVTTLSGGELARVMLARALVSDPDLLIVDEPIAGLDPRHALDSINRLRQHAQTGKLVIAALHDLTLAARYATRIVVMRDGRIYADGTPDSVLNPEQLGAVFEIEALVSEGSGGRYIDFIAPIR